jgi:hypothetical protein
VKVAVVYWIDDGGGQGSSNGFGGAGLMNPHAAAVQIADETRRDEKHQTNSTHQSNKISDNSIARSKPPNPTNPIINP